MDVQDDDRGIATDGAACHGELVEPPHERAIDGTLHRGARRVTGAPRQARGDIVAIVVFLV
ncbi:MAG: hypothetical protein JWO85_3389, partial [Candidatus Eremiobacteraeota bacterium]|nr:hypothetical protein [Candidatus Eremiobacteraeota bacterium]